MCGEQIHTHMILRRNEGIQITLTHVSHSDTAKGICRDGRIGADPRVEICYPRDLVAGRYSTAALSQTQSIKFWKRGSHCGCLHHARKDVLQPVEKMIGQKRVKKGILAGPSVC